MSCYGELAGWLVAQATPKLAVVLPQPPESWYYRHALPWLELGLISLWLETSLGRW